MGNNNYDEYRKHIQDSPLNERTQNELLSISNIKDLENKIKNLNQEIISYKTQLNAKKLLIKEFEDIYQNNQSQRKQIVNQHENGAKIEQKEQENDDGNNNRFEKQEQYLCRTKNKETDSMLEYYLSLGFNDGNDIKTTSPFCDYSLISSHNLLKPLNESLSSNITFYTKDEPLFIKGLIQQIFTNKTQ